MLSERTIAIAENYWAGYLGCAPADFSRPAPLVIPHGEELSDYRGLFALFRHAAPVVSVPSDRCTDLTSFFDRELPERVPTPLQFVEAVTSLCGTVIGPAFIGYCESAALHQPESSVRKLGPDDEPAVNELIASCPSLDWEHGGSLIEEQPTAGAFIGERLVALAGYEIWGEAIAHIAVITNPEFRGRGFGRRVVAEISQYALAAGLLPQYRTLISNAASMRLACDLGFVAFGTSVAVRLPT